MTVMGEGAVYVEFIYREGEIKMQTQRGWEGGRVEESLSVCVCVLLEWNGATFCIIVARFETLQLHSWHLIKPNTYRPSKKIYITHTDTGHKCTIATRKEKKGEGGEHKEKRERQRQN